MKKIFTSILLFGLLITNALSDELEYLVYNGLCEKLTYSQKLDIIKLIELKQLVIADRGTIGNTKNTYTVLVLDNGSISYTSSSIEGCKAVYNHIKRR